jgi:hypothetical protein
MNCDSSSVAPSAINANVKKVLFHSISLHSGVCYTLFLSRSTSSEIQTLNLRIVSQVFYLEPASSILYFQPGVNIMKLFTAVSYEFS